MTVQGSGANHGATEKQQLRAELNTMRALVCLLVKRGDDEQHEPNPDSWVAHLTTSEFGTLNGHAWKIATVIDQDTGAMTVTVTAGPMPKRPLVVLVERKSPIATLDGEPLPSLVAP